MNNTTLNFLDLETTGSNYKADRIVEVALYKYRDGAIIEKFQTLIKPEGFDTYPLTFITGITDQMLEGAPMFAEVSTQLHDLLSDGLFVAHNAQFDLAFLKNEFTRQGLDFNPHVACTLKLSKQLYPQYSKHGIDALISRYALNTKLDTSQRHRAGTDTEAMIYFFEQAYKDHGENKMLNAINTLAYTHFHDEI